jgi:phytoene synthase
MTDETDYCEALVRDADKDRFLATLFAPAGHRSDLYALYAFDLETAAVAHRVRDPMAGEIRLQWWTDALSTEALRSDAVSSEALGADAATGHPVVDAMRTMLARNGIATERLLQLIDARRQALYPDRGRSEAEFELLASETTGGIVLMAAQILGGAPNEAVRLAAHHLAVATAAANVASDEVSFDAAAMSERHRKAARVLIATLPEAVLPAFLPFVLAFDGRAQRAPWRKQWLLWRASKNLARWI